MKFIGNVLAGLTTVIYFFVLFVMAGVLALSSVFSPNYYTEVMNSIDIKEIKLSDLGVTGTEGDITVEEALVDALTEAGLSNTDAEKIINNEKINEVAGELVSDTVTYYVDKKEVPQLDVEDVKEILESDDMSGLVDEVPDSMSAEEITEELNKFIKEALEGGNYVE